MMHPLFLLLLTAVCVLITIRAEAEDVRRTYPYQSCFEIASRMHDVPLDVLLAVAAAESAWNPDARSHANAHGIMQIQWPGTAQHLGVTRVSELYNPCLNIELGARYLRELLDRNDGNLSRALAAYNYGPSRIEGAQVLPSGATRYIEQVNGHRTRILRGAAPAARRAEQAQGELMTFAHVARARRYAETLSARITSADFSWAEADGGYAVTMHVKPEGLSLQDITLLETLGWPGMAGSRR